MQPFQKFRAHSTSFLQIWLKTVAFTNFDQNPWYLWILTKKCIFCEFWPKTTVFMVFDQKLKFLWILNRNCVFFLWIFNSKLQFLWISAKTVVFGQNLQKNTVFGQNPQKPWISVKIRKNRISVWAFKRTTSKRKTTCLIR